MRRFALLAVIVLALPAAGTAAFPGTNGRILFTQELQLLERSTPRGTYLCASATDGRRPLKVAELLSQSIAHPSVTAEGDAVVYSRLGRLFIAAPDGAGERFLANGTTPAWAPDGTRVFYAFNGDIYSVRRDGSDIRPVTSSGAYEQMPAVSPDGGVLAYVRDPLFRTRGSELVVRDLISGSERVLVSTPEIAAPDWSPDGTRIAFTIGGTINTIAAAGGDLRTVATGGDSAEPAYSPDGRLLAFERDGDIWTSTPAGTDLINVTRSPVDEHQPAWQAGTALVPAGSDKPCAIVGTDQGEELVGTEYDDVFYDLGGADTIRGLGGNDRVFDGEGLDRIEGGDGGRRDLPSPGRQHGPRRPRQRQDQRLGRAGELRAGRCAADDLR